MYKSSRINKAGDMEQPAIFCDMCAEKDRRAAVKTCIKCEISMCDQHLQPHLTTPVLLLSHPLTEPMGPGVEGLGGTKCPQHGKLIEYYCLDDLTSVCVSCAIEDQHRLHNIKTLPKAHAELVGKIAEWERDVAARRKESEGLGKWEQSKRKEVSNSSLRLIDAVSKLRDMTLNRVQSSVSARMGCITTGGRSIQAAKGEKDTFRFLQLYSQVQQDVERAKAVDLRKGLEMGQERGKLSKELKEVGEEFMDQAAKLCGSVLMFVDPGNQGESPGNATFDPLTLGHGMSLSADHRKVFYSPQSAAIDQCTLIIKDANSTSPPHRWEIDVSESENYDWTIGFCEHGHTLVYGFVYALCIKDGQLSYLERSYEFGDLYSPMEEFSQPIRGAWVRPKTVEVCLNAQDSSVSFFICSRPHYQRTLIQNMNVMSYHVTALIPFANLQSEPNKFAPQTQWFGRRRSAQRTNQMQALRYNHRGNAFNVPMLLPTIDLTSLLCELL